MTTINVNEVLLTPREKQVLDCMLECMSVKETAQYLHISSKTVEFHRNNIFAKYHVSDHKKLIKKLK